MRHVWDSSLWTLKLSLLCTSLHVRVILCWYVLHKHNIFCRNESKLVTCSILFVAHYVHMFVLTTVSVPGLCQRHPRWLSHHCLWEQVSFSSTNMSRSNVLRLTCFSRVANESLCLFIFFSWQPERQVPFSDVRLPPPADAKKEIGEGEEVEVRRRNIMLSSASLSSFPSLCINAGLLLFFLNLLLDPLQSERTGALWLVAG